METRISSQNHYSPTGSTYDHYELKHKDSEFCGVSILRAGDSMIEPLLELIPNISVGKVLIQRDEKTAEPVFYYSKLPTDIHKSKRVFLLDPMLATGGSACKAIEEIHNKGVPKENITFINLVSCDRGIQRVLKEHPGVHIITASVDPILNEKCYIVPGLGDYGDRFFASTRQ
jgi:uracil phosphoribosyltransferase